MALYEHIHKKTIQNIRSLQQLHNALNKLVASYKKPVLVSDFFDIEYTPIGYPCEIRVYLAKADDSYKSYYYAKVYYV